MEKMPIITKEIIKEHTEIIKKSKESGSFKDSSNKVFNMIAKENPEFSKEVILPTLESDKSEEFKKGYLAGITTLYDILRKQIKRLSYS